MLHAHYFSLSLLLSLLLLSLSLLLSPSSCLTLLLSSFLSLAVFCAIFVWPWHINCRTVKRLKRIAALPQQQLGNSLVHPLLLPVTVPLPPPFPPPCFSSCWLLATFAQFINSLLGFKVSPAAPPPSATTFPLCLLGLRHYRARMPQVAATWLDSLATSFNRN